MGETLFWSKERSGSDGSRLERWKRIGLVAASILAWGTGAWAEGVPVAVSPGSPTGASIVEPCPTFSWGRVEGARSYEVIAYRISEHEPEGEPVFTRRIAGSALGWTPSLDRCLEPGDSYAWSVRAEAADGFSEWSDPVFFDVASTPEPDLAEALELVRRHLGDGGPTPVESGDGQPGAAFHGRASDSPAATADSALGSAPMALNLPLPETDAKLTVGGEVRSVDADGEARIWGQGRPNTYVYGFDFLGSSVACNSGGTLHGLSAVAVDWGSAASACPAGTWVCRASEIGGCDTERPQGVNVSHGFDCDGSPLNFPADQHVGWTVSLAEGIGLKTTGVTIVEDGEVTGRALCKHLPVWCCWE